MYVLWPRNLRHIKLSLKDITPTSGAIISIIKISGPALEREKLGIYIFTSSLVKKDILVRVKIRIDNSHISILPSSYRECQYSEIVTKA